MYADILLYVALASYMKFSSILQIYKALSLYSLQQIDYESCIHFKEGTQVYTAQRISILNFFKIVI